MYLKMLKLNLSIIFGVIIIAVFASAFAQAHTRIQTTLIGYELGKLKKTESHLLERRSQLQMEYAKLTTRNHLTLLANEKKTFKNLGDYAIH